MQEIADFGTFLQMCRSSHIYCLISYEQFLEIQLTLDMLDFKMCHLDHSQAPQRIKNVWFAEVQIWVIFQTKHLVRRMALFYMFAYLFSDWLNEGNWILISASAFSLLKYIAFDWSM